jgi:hypothetical protein
MSTILKNIIVDKFKEINDNTNQENREGGWFEVEDTIDKSFELLATGIFEYITNSNKTYFQSSKIVSTSVGVLVTPAGASSLLTTDITTTDISMGSLEALISALKCAVGASTDLTPLEYMQKFFEGLSAWLNMGWLANIVQGTTLTTVTGVGPILFPAMATVGEPCFLSMQSETPLSYEESHGIMAKYIHQGLVANFIAPIPTAGTVVSNIFTGMTTTIWTFN